MANFKFYSRVSIIIFSIILSGIGGSLMMAYNLIKIGKKNVAAALVVISLSINLFLIWERFSFPRQWNLNKTIGWGYDITNFIWLREMIIFFILPNLFWGILMGYPIWNRYLSDGSEYTKKKLVVPVLTAIAVWIMFFAMGKHVLTF